MHLVSTSPLGDLAVAIVSVAPRRLLRRGLVEKPVDVAEDAPCNAKGSLQDLLRRRVDVDAIPIGNARLYLC